MAYQRIDLLTFGVAAAMMAPSAALAQTWSNTEHWAFSPALASIAADAWVRDAVHSEKSGDPGRATAAWWRAAVLAPEFGPIAIREAARIKLGRGESLTAVELAGLRALDLPGSHRLVVQASVGQPEWGQDVVAALVSQDAEDVCGDLRATVHTGADAVQQAFYARCTLPEETLWGQARGFAPTVRSLLDRASRLNADVRFTTANETLDRVVPSSPQETCEKAFLKGQVVFRLRRRDEAYGHWKHAAEACRNVDAEVHVRALYALGKRAYDVGELDTTQAAFSELYAAYPERSHADDALLYLARVARQRGDAAAERAAVDDAVTKYPGGDMVFEIAWEHLEPAYRAGAWQAFVDGLSSLALPAHDDQYYSQGRLEYFAARAHEKLGRPDEAQKLWTSVWLKYPFSFYGYLSHEVLAANGNKPPEIAMQQTNPAWLETDRWTFSVAHRLLRAGATEAAAAVSGGFSQGGDDLWRRAYTLDRAGVYPSSHNIVRRKISGVPWLVDGQANETQMRVAWPNPFGRVVEAACDAEAAQAGAALVDPAFPTAIMREESSFIEDIESYAGALGLMQLMPATALGHDDDVNPPATPDRLKTADVNVRVGVDHIYALARRWNGHPALMAAAYNAGSGALGKWIKRLPNDDIALFVEDIPPLQTRDYTKRVVGSYAAYLYLSGKALDPKITGPAR